MALPRDSILKGKYLHWGVGVFCLLIYLKTLYPSVPPGDSGELITAAHTLGLAHPPGYPLFILIGKLFSYFPIGSIAWRINAVSAVFNSLSAVLIYLIVQMLTANAWASLAAAGLFAFAPLTWTYACAAEVFPLNHFLILSFYFLFLRFLYFRNSRDYYLGAWVFGLGVSNHHAMIFYCLPIALAQIWNLRSQERTLKRALWTLFWVFIGMTPYCILPWASISNPNVLWGDTASIEGFLRNFFRKDYGTLSLMVNELEDPGIFFRLWLYLKDLFFQTLFLGPLLGGMGLIQLWRSRDPKIKLWTKTLAVGFFLYLATILEFGKTPLHLVGSFEILQRFWQQANLPLFILMGVGLSTLPKRPLFKCAYLILPLVQLFTHYQSQDQSKNESFFHYAKSTLESLPPHSVLLANFEYAIYTTYYLQQSEGFRTDVQVIPLGMLGAPWMPALLKRRFPDLSVPITSPGEGITAQSFVTLNLGKFPIFVVPHLEFVSPEQSQSLGWQFIPYGYTFQIAQQQSGISSFQEWDKQTSMVFNSPSFLAIDDKNPSSSTWNQHLKNLQWEANYRRGTWILDQALREPQNPSLAKRAREIFESIHGKYATPPPIYYKNMALAYQADLKFEPTREKKLRLIQIWEHYLRMSNDPERPAIEAKLAVLKNESQ